MSTVAYLGPEGTNAHVAALKRFGRSARYLHAPTVDDVFTMVERRRADLGVVPIENSLEGSVTHTLDRFIDFLDSAMQIHGEIELPIRHFLLLHKRAALPDITMVVSHPQALAQCRRWLAKHLKQADQIETDSTATAVDMICMKLRGETDRHLVNQAAIGRQELARGRGLQALPIPIEGDNKTRFLVVGLGEAPRSTRSKTTVLFAVKDQPGALYDALVPFKQHKINLTKIESRPSKRKAWEYLFFIDFPGHVSEPRVKRALAALKRSTSLLRVLGSYPTAS